MLYSLHSVIQPRSLRALLSYTDSGKLFSLYTIHADIHSLPVTLVVLVAAVRAVVMTVVDSLVVTAVRAVTVSPLVIVISGRSSVVVPSGSFPAVGKAQGAEEGDDDEKEDGLDVHCKFECMMRI